MRTSATPDIHRRRPSFAWLVPLLLLGAALPATAATNTEAAQRAINFLSADVANWAAANNCVACHRQGAPLFGLSNAAANGYNMAAVTANGNTNAQNLAYIAQRIRTFQSSNGSWENEPSNTSYAAFGLAGHDQYVNTQYSSALVMVANWAASTQSGGRWGEATSAFPINYGNVPVTARLMTAIARAKQHVDPARAAQYQAVLDRAAAYLRNNLYNTAEGHNSDGMPRIFQVAWAIVGLKAAGPGLAGENTAAIETLANRLLATSAASGPGWASLPGAAADDFNTGIAVYALCLADREPSSNQRLFNAIEWLKSRQSPDGSWRTGTTTFDIPTTFAALGLACFGDFSVSVSVVGPDRKEFPIYDGSPQQTTYSFRVRNEGYQADTYNLSTQGGLPGWTATLDRTSLFLPSGGEATVTLTVTAPANLLPSLLSEVTVTASSGGAAGVRGSARISTYTPPPPPVTGRGTTTTLLSPTAGSRLAIGQSTVLSARVVDALGSRVSGPARGVVTFFVAGVALGADDDADGDGVFSLPWNPTTDTWTTTGTQDYRAVYSGVTLPSPMTHLLGSTASQTLIIDPFPFTPPNVTISNQPGFTRASELDVWGYVTPATAGAFISSAVFTVNGGAPIPVTPGNGGLVFTSITLVEGPNIIQLRARDSLGGVTTRQINVTVDRVPPVITILNPANGAALSNPAISVTSVIDEQTPTRVETQWASTTLLEFGSGTVTHTVNMPNGGSQPILVRATDSAGNVTEAVVTVWLDSAPPVVNTDPAHDALIAPRPDNILPYRISVQALSSTTVRLSDGRSFSLPRGGGFIDTSLTLAPGTNTFTIEATAETGQRTTLTRTVRYDTQPPVATLLSPTPGATTSGLITLRARITDNFGPITYAAFSRDMSAIRAATRQPDGTWTAELDTRELVDGTHTVDVWMSDGVNNFTIQSFIFFVDNP